MSVDVEDWFQVWALRDVIKRDDWGVYSLRVEDNTKRLLDLFDQYQATATFFTLGWIAERCSGLIKEIHQRGHEIASHGYDHTKVFDQSEEEFKSDITKTKTILEDLIGANISGYRAAGFSIDARTPWAHHLLAQTGHLYSSSIHPIVHDHYNYPDAPRFAFCPIEGSHFKEIPVSTVERFGRRFSCAGGGWFRLLPYQWTNSLLTKLISQENQPAVFYMHPWEIDPDQPRVDGLTIKSEIRHYTNLDVMKNKLARLLHQWHWRRYDEVFQVTAERDAL